MACRTASSETTILAATWGSASVGVARTDVWERDCSRVSTLVFNESPSEGFSGSWVSAHYPECLSKYCKRPANSGLPSETQPTVSRVCPPPDKEPLSAPTAVKRELP